MDKVLYSGNEAIARGAYEAGVRICSAYPGTPSTEIFETRRASPERFLTASQRSNTCVPSS